MYNTKKQIKTSVIIGINGLDCSGKTYFSKSLKNYFTDMGVSSVVVDIDTFNLKDIEDQTYESFSKKQFTNKDLEMYYSQIIDFNLARKKILELIDNYSIIIIEGIFIYKKEFVDLFNIKIFLETSYQIAIKRFQLRQKRNNDTRSMEIFKEIWEPSHFLYLKEIDPKNLSDLVINNDDYSHRHILKKL
tara:strand:- start:1142 stop:1708 length:567 start_codon:yes stop_codon:yes gene_type:complete